MHSGPAHHKLDFIGDHLAINFINTLRAVEPFEVFQTDEDVMDWLHRAGVSTPPKAADWPREALVEKARQLREIALKAVETRKAGKRPSLDELNSFLEHSISHPQLVRRKSKIEIEKVYSGQSVEEFLSPIAESVADLLANGDFEPHPTLRGGHVRLVVLRPNEGASPEMVQSERVRKQGQSCGVPCALCA